MIITLHKSTCRIHRALMDSTNKETWQTDGFLLDESGVPVVQGIGPDLEVLEVPAVPADFSKGRYRVASLTDARIFRAEAADCDYEYLDTLTKDQINDLATLLGVPNVSTADTKFDMITSFLGGVA